MKNRELRFMSQLPIPESHLLSLIYFIIMRGYCDSSLLSGYLFDYSLDALGQSIGLGHCVGLAVDAYDRLGV